MLQINVKVAGKLTKPKKMRKHLGRQFTLPVTEVIIPDLGDVWRPVQVDLESGDPQQYVFLSPERVDVRWRRTYVRDALTRYIKQPGSKPRDPFQVQVWIAGEWLNICIANGELTTIEPEDA